MEPLHGRSGGQSLNACICAGRAGDLTVEEKRVQRYFDVLQLVSLALFLALFIGRTVTLRVQKGINPIRLSLGKNGVHHALSLSLFIGVNVWAGLVVITAVRPSWWELPAIWGGRWFDHLAAKGVGTALIVLAFAILVRALIDLGPSWRLGIDTQNPGELVTSGIYAFSRNPIYLFFDLYFLATFLINGLGLFLLLAILAAVNLHAQTIQEERFLAKTFGAEYEAYRARTGRYLTCRRPVIGQEASYGRAV